MSCLCQPAQVAEPRLRSRLVPTPAFFRRRRENWRPGEPLRIGSGRDGFPGPLEELNPGKYAIQAVVRLNLDTHRIGDGEGNLYGPVVHAELDPKRRRKVALKVDHARCAPGVQVDRRIKLVELHSPKLSEFHHRPIKHRAAVILPEEIARGGQATKLPTVYIIPGFGGDHFMATAMADSPRMAFGNDFIRVVLDPDCGTGHHVFADSATNGPRGTALVEEFIPYIEAHSPRSGESSCPLAQWPFIRRLEQPLASGDLSRLLRRYMVDQPRPRRLPRFSTDQSLRVRREHVPRPRREAAADRPDREHARALLRPVLARWTT